VEGNSEIVKRLREEVEKGVKKYDEVYEKISGYL
jgi:hypothetical protein